MSLKIAIQMDPIENIDINGDSTFRIMEEAQKRGHELFYYMPSGLSYQNGNVIANGNSLIVERTIGNHYKLGDIEYEDNITVQGHDAHVGTSKK